MIAGQMWIGRSLDAGKDIVDAEMVAGLLLFLL
jgi:hypothetical protein